MPGLEIGYRASDCREQIEAYTKSYVITGIHRQKADEPVPAIRGFVRSPFSPLIYHSVKQAAEMAGVTADEPQAERKGIVLASQFVDAVTEEETWKDLIQGKRLSPIMFPQSVPSAIIGFLAKELRILGPMTCLGASGGDGTYLALQQALDWLEDLDADVVIVTFCDVPSARAEQWMEDYVRSSAIIPSFGGGVVTIVLESRAHAKQRGAVPVIRLSDFYQQMNNNSAAQAFHGMARACE